MVLGQGAIHAERASLSHLCRNSTQSVVYPGDLLPLTKWYKAAVRLRVRI